MLDGYDIGWIYVAKRGKPTRQNSDQIKVGVSTRPSNRDGKTLVWATKVHFARSCERVALLHLRASHVRMTANGEWFRATPAHGKRVIRRTAKQIYMDANRLRPFGKERRYNQWGRAPR